jgi:two-component system phosphate regulon sensor histidine kinase PhoR
MYSLIAEENAITLTTEFPAEDIEIEGDKNRVSRIFSNIIDNALKYTPQGGKVCMSLFKTEEEVVTTVTDNGIGIPEEELSLIWQRLYRGEKARQTGKGLGLGMNIVKTFTEAHKGRVEVESSEQGTSFTVTLPLKQSD